MKKQWLTRIERNLSAAGLCLCAASVPAQDLYTFDQLTSGVLQGQDNWVASERAVIEAGLGVNTSLVFNNNTNNLPQASASRVNDAAFSYPALAFGMTNAVLGFDFRVNDPSGANTKVDFLLAHRDHGFTDQGKIGLGYNGSLKQFMVIRADGAGYGGTLSNFVDAPGHWFRVRLVTDFTKYGANGSGSLFVRDLTAAEDVYRPVAVLQNISLLIVNQGADPAGWDRMDARACNAQMDNLFVGFTTNTAPALGILPNRTVDKGTLLTFACTATDGDSPAQLLRFSLGSGSPADANITPDGVFTWTPAQTQGAGAYNICVKVTDSGLPPLSATRCFTVTVTESNHSPSITSIGDQAVEEGNTLTFAVTATDADLPAQHLSFSLGQGAPAGASITTGGVFTWTPSLGYWPATNLISVVVADDGVPPLSAAQSFAVVVNHLPAPASPVLVRSGRDSARVSVGALLGSDPDGDPMSLASVNPASTGGGTVSAGPDWVVYTPPDGPTVDDTFAYTVADARGATAVGTVTVRVAPGLESGLYVAWENATTLQVRLRGSGAALRTYWVEFKDALPSSQWQPAGTATADATGAFEYVDHVSTVAPARFYRTTCP